MSAGATRFARRAVVLFFGAVRLGLDVPGFVFDFGKFVAHVDG
jgi:hypothetical protein